MLSVQKPVSITLLSPAYHHRRHPSAPVVVPTKIPGVLSISKPSRPSPQPRVQAQQLHQQRIRPTPKPKSASRSPNLHQAVVAEKEEPQPAAKATPAATPEKNNRGRQGGKPQKPTTRSPSHSSTRGGRRPHRQSSPPIQDPVPSSQAEAPSMPTHQLSDPFLDDISNVRQINPLQSASLNTSVPPTLSPRPSGKLARRRQQQQNPTNKNQNTSAHAIPVPTQFKRYSHPQMSRSEPQISHIQPAVAKTQTQIKAPVWDAFPICDDMTDAGDATDSERVPPVTPTRPRSKAYTHANSAPPRSAPLHGFFPKSVSPPSPSPADPPVALSQRRQQGDRKHRRTPSDGVFTMSSDEEANSSSTSNNSGLTPNVEALFRMVRNQRRGSFSATPPYHSGSSSSSASSSLVGTPTTVPRTREGREKQLEREAAAAAYFASSSFQNSPSPDELPPPLFA
ncbi:hypothetical protein BDN72DRAFT_854774 [Pluteus cervinus]|uniref:Uncharacterized protein n=1 Tax=Pluteus cervinus TaxID=181527 RepID=A0ACD3B6E2_9AGAR|nr:hypothetical protein BDN72DRAFT_854774 [Pluteus cervinus]